MGDQTVHALRGVSLDIAEGELSVAIMGASGSGKSTPELNILGCRTCPTAGELPAGRRSGGGHGAGRSWPPSATGASASCSSSSTCWPRTSALENVELPMVYAGRQGQPSGAARALDALARVGLAERAHHTPVRAVGRSAAARWRSRARW